jgi:hypothetical protein
MGSGRALIGLLVGAALLPWPSVAAWAAPGQDLKPIDVCAVVPGSEVARIAGGSLVEAKRFNAPDATVARCVYRVAPPSGKDQSAWVVELFPAGTLDEVRPYVEPPVREVPDLGDGAYEYQDPDTGRWRLYALKRGDVTVSVTGTDEPVVRKIATFVLSRPQR